MKSHCRGLGAPVGGDAPVGSRLQVVEEPRGGIQGGHSQEFRLQGGLPPVLRLKFFPGLWSPDLEVPGTVTQLKWVLNLRFVPSTTGAWSWVPRGVEVYRAK